MKCQQKQQNIINKENNKKISSIKLL